MEKLTITNYEELPEVNHRRRSYRVVFDNDITDTPEQEIKDACFQYFRLWTDGIYVIDSKTVNYHGYID